MNFLSRSHTGREGWALGVLLVTLATASAARAVTQKADNFEPPPGKAEAERLAWVAARQERLAAEREEGARRRLTELLSEYRNRLGPPVRNDSEPIGFFELRTRLHERLQEATFLSASGDFDSLARVIDELFSDVGAESPPSHVALILEGLAHCATGNSEEGLRALEAATCAIDVQKGTRPCWFPDDSDDERRYNEELGQTCLSWCGELFESYYIQDWQSPNPPTYEWEERWIRSAIEACQGPHY